MLLLLLLFSLNLLCRCLILPGITSAEPWTEEEMALFAKGYATVGKDFALIASQVRVECAVQ